MNECCMIPGNARIIESQNPKIAWRVICSFCGHLLHGQPKEESK